MRLKKSFLGILLSFAMMLGLMPGMNLTAYASSHPVNTDYSCRYNDNGTIKSIDVSFAYVDSDGDVERSKDERKFRWIFTTDKSKVNDGEHHIAKKTADIWKDIADEFPISSPIYSPIINGSIATYTKKPRSDYPEFTFAGPESYCTLISASCSIDDANTLNQFQDKTKYYGLLCHSYGNDSNVFYTGVNIEISYNSIKRYTITLNGVGSGETTIEVGNGEPMPVIVPDDLPKRDGYIFEGYYDTQDGVDGTKYYNSDGTSAKNWDKTNDTGNNLYPHWTKMAAEVETASFNTSITTKQKDGKLKISWDKFEGAASYKVYATYCGNKLPKSATKKTSGTSIKIKKLKGKKIDFSKNFKLYIEAFDANGNSLGKTPTAHIAGKDNTKYTNPKSVKVSSSSVSLSVGGISKIKASQKLDDKSKKLLSNNHASKFRYRSDNAGIATVDKNGNIAAVASGSCYIYVYAKNGLAKKVAVTVN